MDCVVLRQEFEAEAFIPASGENVDANLPADRKLDVTVGEFLSHCLHHRFADLVFLQKEVTVMKSCEMLHMCSMKTNQL